MTISRDPAATDDERTGGAAGAPFDEFFQANYSTTVRLVHLLTGSNTVAEDLAQDAFARVLPRLAQLEEPRSYLRTVTVNLCRDWHRGRQRESDRFRRHGVSAAETTNASDELLHSIRRLPYRQQAVLVLRYWLDLTEADIAHVLACRAGTVKSLHARALAAIRKEVQ